MIDFEHDPHDPAAEVAVLAACFQSPVATDAASKILSPGDFYDPAREEVFKAIQKLRHTREPVDTVTLGAALRKAGPLVDRCFALLPELVVSGTLPGDVEWHAGQVRECAIRRRVINLTLGYRQRALAPSESANGLLDEMASDVARMRESTAPDIDTMLLSEMLDEPEEPYDWVVPGLLERMDRLVLTGTEGLGKSTLMRQIGVFAAAGLHPFRPNDRAFRPCRVHFIECENTKRHTRRQIRAIVAKARSKGEDPGDRVFFDFRPEGIDLLRDKDASWLHRALDATQPDLVVIGPFYKVFPRAVQTDDEAAPAIHALDTIRNRNVALIVEAHSGHSKSASGKRDVRPRGSSALMGWPEFGYGIRSHSDRDAARLGAVELVPWRGDRDRGRSWPRELGKGGAFPWTDLNHDPERRGA